MARDSKGAENPSEIHKFEVKPLLFVKQYEFYGKTVQIGYSEPGIIDKINDEKSEENIILYNEAGRLSKQISSFENIDYEYDIEGRLSTIRRLKPTSGDENFRKFTYNEYDQIQRIEKRFVGSDNVNDISISYREGETLPLGLIYSRANDNRNGTFDILYQDSYLFTWDERENLVEILVERNLQMGKGFEFFNLTKLTYDTMQNPAYDIIKEGFGFDNFFTKTENNYNLKSLFFDDGLGWVGKNNILTYERSYVSVFSSFLHFTSRRHTYDYNVSGYPKSAMIMTMSDNNPSTFYERSWTYERP